MNIYIKDSTVVRPAKQTPKHCLRISDLDLLVPASHSPTVHLYRRPNDCFNFFESGLLKEALSNVLVSFYPVAGRLGKDENGRMEIHCNGEGVLYLEAETSYVIDEFTQEFEANSKLLQFVPTVELTDDISSYPLLLIQVTHFKCGGVCVGVGLHHTLVDGGSIFHFINSWAEMARGFPISIPPFFDRTVLSVGIPTSPTFDHIEYDPPPSINTPTQNMEFQSNPSSQNATAILKLSLDQINFLKEKSKKENGWSSVKYYSKFEILAAHIWRCVCKARGLSDDQATKLYISTNGRSRLNPEIPSGYFGNAVFFTASMALSGDIQSEPLSYTIYRIHEVLKRMNNEYLKSSLAYLQQYRGVPNLEPYNCPNLFISKLTGMPIYDANFGWGQSLFAMPILGDFDGIAYILPSANNDGSLSVAIALETNSIQLFKKFFYEVFLEYQNVRSRY